MHKTHTFPRLAMLNPMFIYEPSNFKLYLFITHIIISFKIIIFIFRQNRFGKRSEVESEVAGAAKNDVIGPKDIAWLKYYLRSSYHFINDVRRP